MFYFLSFITSSRINFFRFICHIRVIREARCYHTRGRTRESDFLLCTEINERRYIASAGKNRFAREHTRGRREHKDRNYKMFSLRSPSLFLSLCILISMILQTSKNREISRTTLFPRYRFVKKKKRIVEALKLRGICARHQKQEKNIVGNNNLQTRDKRVLSGSLLRVTYRKIT